MLEQFLHHINSNQLCTRSHRLLLAVSGGLDSVVMVHLFHAAGFEVGVAHGNFQLRGEESDRDEAFVKELCTSLNIPFYNRRWDTLDYADENRVSVQMAARDLRYAWFQELVAIHGYDYVATAHHHDDVLETILLHWIHGTGAEGFAGIPVRNGQVIRPLLFADRAAIHQYATAHGLTWREDSSNFTTDYARNHIRHRVLPELRALNPSLGQTVSRGLHKLQGDLWLLSQGFNHWMQAHTQLINEKLIIQKAGIRQAGEAATGLVYRCLREYGFTLEWCAELVNALDGQSGKRFLSSTHQAVIDRDTVIVSPVLVPWADTPITQEEGLYRLGNWQLSSALLPDVRRSFSPWEATLDRDKLTFPLTWRRWRPGDVFHPLGMQHSKKISDFLIDNKVSVADKESVTVIESGEAIVWVAGHRIDDRFKITADTRRVLSLRLEPYFV